jgi:hypothetical protein
MQHLFIAAPFGGRAAMKLFSTHPPIPERIAALEEQARRMGQLGPDPRAAAGAELPLRVPAQASAACWRSASRRSQWVSSSTSTKNSATPPAVSQGPPSS